MFHGDGVENGDGDGDGDSDASNRLEKRWLSEEL